MVKLLNGIDLGYRRPKSRSMLQVRVVYDPSPGSSHPQPVAKFHEEDVVRRLPKEVGYIAVQFKLADLGKLATLLLPDQKDC